MSEHGEQPPRMGQKGGPSPNPAGRRGKLASSDIVDAKRPSPGKPAGSDGVRTFGGWLVDNGERHARLIGSQKWITYDNLIANVAIVATAVRIALDLMGSVRWYCEPNPLGGSQAEQCAALHDELLFSGFDSGKPWRNVIKRQGLKKYRGFAMHEMVPMMRGDGRVGVDLQHRPQWTVFRWSKPDEQRPWDAIEQRTRSGNSYVIDRSALFYSVEDTLTDSPEGVGLLRHVVESQRVLEVYQRLEGIGYETDMRGLRIGRAPLAKLTREAVDVGGCAPGDTAAIQGYVAALTGFLTDLLENATVTPDRHIMLDSTPYFEQDVDGTIKPGQLYEWNVETAKATVTGLADMAHAIERLTREIARVMCAEWLLMGDKGGGSRAMHADKTDMFGLVINACLDDLADDASRDIAPQLTAWNGYLPNCAPRYCHEPVATESAKEAAEILQLLYASGFQASAEAGSKILERIELPPEVTVIPASTDVNPLDTKGDS